MIGRILAVALLAAGVALSAKAGPEAPGRILGYQFDISRCKVPTMSSLKERIDLLARLGYTQVQFYTEHAFAYSKHEAVWRDASPLTPAEARELDAYCAARGIELVPNQNSFGHMGQWLRHPGYNDLAEVPGGGTVIRQWGNRVMARPETLSPTDPRSLELLSGLYDELLPCFRSKYVNVGCDETMELMNWSEGANRSAKELAEKGSVGVYSEFLLKIQCEVARRGRTMMFWGDIVLHAPEVLKNFTKDVIALNWGYEASWSFERTAPKFAEAGVPFYVCPGTSAWGSLFGRTTNMLGNLADAFRAAERHGALGVLLADWGDRGNPQPWLVSLPAVVWAAHRAQGKALTRAELAVEIDAIAGARVGEALLEIGDVYLACGGRTGNSSELFLMLTDGAEYRRHDEVTDETLAKAREVYRTARAKVDLAGARGFVRDGFEMLDLLAEAVELKAKSAFGPKNFRAIFEPRYRALWLRQNRVGGLEESLDLVFGR